MWPKLPSTIKLNDKQFIHQDFPYMFSKHECPCRVRTGSWLTWPSSHRSLLCFNVPTVTTHPAEYNVQHVLKRHFEILLRPTLASAIRDVFVTVSNNKLATVQLKTSVSPMDLSLQVPVPSSLLGSPVHIHWASHAWTTYHNCKSHWSRMGALYWVGNYLDFDDYRSRGGWIFVLYYQPYGKQVSTVPAPSYQYESVWRPPQQNFPRLPGFGLHFSVSFFAWPLPPTFMGVNRLTCPTSVLYTLAL